MNMPDGHSASLRSFECRTDHSSTIERIVDELMRGETVCGLTQGGICEEYITLDEVLLSLDDPDLREVLQRRCRSLLYAYVRDRCPDVIQEREEEEHET